VAARVFEREVELFRQHGGGLRMAEALRLGLNRKTLYAMRDAGVVVPVSRGVYRLASLDPLAHPDLVTVAKRVPQGVLCLISALSFHELTTQVPHTIDVALELADRSPDRVPESLLIPESEGAPSLGFGSQGSVGDPFEPGKSGEMECS
jgi:predicted transcriptional regulator of viral defense system